MLTVIFGCTGLNQKDNFESFKESVSSIHPNISKVSDVALLIEKSEADYIPDLTLNTGIIHKYMQEDTLFFLGNKILSAAIMGMYTADIGYNLVFYQRDNSFESFSAAKIIANELGFGDVYVENIFSRYEDNDFTLDSMLIEFDKGLSRFNTEESDTDRLRIIIGFIIGNYLEKQYHIHSTIQSYKEKDISDDLKLLLAQEFIYVALNQKAALDAVLLSIEKNQYADDPGYLYKKFTDLNTAYKELLPLQEKIENLAPEDVFQNPQFDELYFQIKDMREDFALTVENEII